MAFKIETLKIGELNNEGSIDLFIDNIKQVIMEKLRERYGREAERADFFDLGELPCETFIVSPNKTYKGHKVEYAINEGKIKIILLEFDRNISTDDKIFFLKGVAQTAEIKTFICGKDSPVNNNRHIDINEDNLILHIHYQSI